MLVCESCKKWIHKLLSLLMKANSLRAGELAIRQHKHQILFALNMFSMIVTENNLSFPFLNKSLQDQLLSHSFTPFKG